MSQASENGQGGAAYIGAGYGSWTGVPTIEFITIAFVFMLGEYIAVDGKGVYILWVCVDEWHCPSTLFYHLFFPHPPPPPPPKPKLAGFVVWVGSPVVEASVLEYAFQLGSVIYVGAGAMVLWGTPLVEFYGPFVSRSTEFWVMGTCEYEGGGAGGGGGETSRALAIPATEDRALYNLPTFVAPLEGCQKLIDYFYGYESGSDGGGGETSRARALSHNRRGPAAVAAAKGMGASAKAPKALKTLAAAPRVARPKSQARRKLSPRQRKLRAFFQQGGHTNHLPVQVRRHATNLWHRDHLEDEDAQVLDGASDENRKLVASPMNPLVRGRRMSCLFPLFSLSPTSPLPSSTHSIGHFRAGRQHHAHHQAGPQEAGEARSRFVDGGTCVDTNGWMAVPPPPPPPS